MAKETKEERVVRSMLDQVAEHLHELKNLEQNSLVKELDIERWSQSLLKSCLGYTSTNGYSILAQENRGKMRPDLVVSKDDRPLFVVEIKKLGYDLAKSDLRSGKTQLSEYLRNIGNIKYGILCNGYQWKLFDFSDISLGGVEIISIDLRPDGESLDISKRAIEDLCWDLLDFHEVTYSSKSWVDSYKEATAFSPESLAKAILSSDSIKYIAKVIRGEFDYKANTEVLIDKINHLLEYGLNDQNGGWSTEKKAEIQKFAKLQKRACRRKRKVQKNDKTVSGAAVDEIVQANTENKDQAS